MADTPDLGSGPARGGGSSPLSRTIFTKESEIIRWRFQRSRAKGFQSVVSAVAGDSRVVSGPNRVGLVAQIVRGPLEIEP